MAIWWNTLWMLKKDQCNIQERENNDEPIKGCSFFLNNLTTKEVFYTFNTITVLFTTYKRAELCPTWNKNKSVSSKWFKKKISWLHKWKRPHQPWEAVAGGGGAVTQKPPKVTKTPAKKVKKEAKEKAKAVVEEGATTKDVEYEAGTSTAQHIHHQFGTSIEK